MLILEGHPSGKDSILFSVFKITLISSIPTLILIIIVNIMFVYSCWTVGGGGTNCISITVTTLPPPPTSTLSSQHHKVFLLKLKHYSVPTQQFLRALPLPFYIPRFLWSPRKVKQDVSNGSMCCKTPLDADRLEATICIEKKVCTRNPLVEVAPGTLSCLSSPNFERE